MFLDLFREPWICLIPRFAVQKYAKKIKSLLCVNIFPFFLLAAKIMVEDVITALPYPKGRRYFDARLP